MSEKGKGFLEMLGFRFNTGGGGEVRPKVPEKQESEIVRLARELSGLSDEVLLGKIPPEYTKGKKNEALALLQEIRDRIVEVAQAAPSSGSKSLVSSSGLLRLSRRENNILIVGHNKQEWLLGLCKLVHSVFPIIEIDTW
ncbi:MAG: hypothetical protein V1664_05695 [Candidatus Uhrbacteria bacterium]